MYYFSFHDAIEFCMDNKDKTNNIKTLRDEYGITQKNLGEVVGMSQQAIGKMENGKRRIPDDILRKLSDYFHVSTDFILNRTTSRSTIDVNNEIKKLIYENYSTLSEMQNFTLDEQRFIIQMIVNFKKLRK